MTDQHTVTSTLVQEASRVKLTSTLFGVNFPLRLEPCIFSIARKLSPEYHGGYWTFHLLSNGGFYMAPNHSTPFPVAAENGFCSHLSPEEFGIVVCLYAYSGLSFGGDTLAEVCAEQYHLLRAFALDHPEARSIMAATD